MHASHADLLDHRVAAEFLQRDYEPNFCERCDNVALRETKHQAENQRLRLAPIKLRRLKICWMPPSFFPPPPSPALSPLRTFRLFAC